MTKKEKTNAITIIVIVTILVENFFAYTFFEGRRGYLELLLCGFAAHIVVGVVVGLIANILIREDGEGKK